MKKNDFVMIVGLIVIGFVLILSYTVIYGQVSNSDKSNTTFQTIQIGKSPNGIAIDPHMHKVYVTDNDSKKITVIDITNNNKKIKNITNSGIIPYGIAIDPNNHKVYVTNFYNNSISVINETNDTVIKNITGIENRPFGISIDPTMHKVYVTNKDSDNITVINGTTDKLIKKNNISQIDIPAAIVVDPNYHKIWISCGQGTRICIIDEKNNKAVSTNIASNSLSIDNKTNRIYAINTDNNTISVINTKNNKVIKTLTQVGVELPTAMAIDPNSQKAYVITRGLDRISVIDLNNIYLYKGAKPNENLDIGIEVSKYPTTLTIDPTTHKVYVINQGSHSVSVIDEQDDKVINKASIQLKSPREIAIDPTTHKVYVTNYYHNSVSVINETTNKVIKNITVGKGPFGIAIDPHTHKVYVTNFANDSVTVINTSDKVLKNITVGKGPYGIAIDPTTHRIYVANFANDSVTVINTSDKVLRNITVGKGPYGIAIDPTTHRIYVANFASNSVTVINASDKVFRNIPVGESPEFIAIDPNTHDIYVTNFYSTAVTKIDPFIIDPKNKTPGTTPIPLQKMPGEIAIDPHTHKVYVTNFASNSLSVIDEKNNRVNHSQPEVGRGPYGIAIDPTMHRIYVTDYDSNLVSILDENTNKLVEDVNFNTNASSGYIKCDGNNIITKQHILIKYNASCTAIANNGFQFQSWQENLNKNSVGPIIVSHLYPTVFNYIANFFDSSINFLGIEPSLNYSLNFLNNKSGNKIVPFMNSVSKFFNIKSSEDAATIHIKKFGNYTATFKALPAPLPPEFLTTIFSFAVSTVLGSWLIPPFVRWIKSKADIKNLNNYHKKISLIYNDGKIDEKDIGYLDNLKNSISDTYAKGKLNEAQYTNLKKELSMQYGEIYKKGIDNMNGIDATEKEKQINQLQDEIEDAYSKEKITELEYNVLQKRLENFK